ncbi:MAG: DUF1641 domain-containing protein [Gemmatimonadaceae bacterium]|jgi:hypothetical protein|uniref:DUF1641 domain-containing protein n=1 Tax=Gemmatimonas sp. UBA7669 TaxID=1946568 RepID=UPI0025BCC2B9|nr:DUF1641 domain-containing protein [Gemmatimonas sp. UBA7669]MBL0890237.1 DUF1641 domain-containing protein [Gemmatimonadaceae bacterium]MBX9855381.1 DUF1641 domain-containing protein [Gemmatimonadaceae bacterium]
MGTALPSASSAAQEQLLARLSEEKTVDALNRLLDRLEVIAFVADALDGFLARANIVAESVAESVSDLKKLTGDETATGDVIGRIPQLARVGVQLADISATPAFQRLIDSGLIERLGDERTIDAVKAVLDRLELAAFTLEAIDGFLRRGDTIATALSDDVEELKRASQNDFVKLQDVLSALPPLVAAGQTLVKSGMLEPRTVEVLATIGRSAATSYDEAHGAPADEKPMGVLALLKALRDPDVARALQFGLKVSKAYGQSLAR